MKFDSSKIIHTTLNDDVKLIRGALEIQKKLAEVLEVDLEVVMSVAWLMERFIAGNEDFRYVDKIRLNKMRAVMGLDDIEVVHDGKGESIKGNKGALRYAIYKSVMEEMLGNKPALSPEKVAEVLTIEAKDPLEDNELFG